MNVLKLSELSRGTPKPTRSRSAADGRRLVGSLCGLILRPRGTDGTGGRGREGSGILGAAGVGGVGGIERLGG